jgi:hypothetical protein
MTLDSESKLSRFEGNSFADLGMTSIQWPSCVEVSCKSSFFGHESLAFAAFDVDSYIITLRYPNISHIPSSLETIFASVFLDAHRL